MRSYPKIITLNEWVEEIRVTPKFLNNLQLMYEWEYKYNKILSTPMQNTVRQMNILNLISDKMVPVLEDIIERLKKVYASWLERHEIFVDMEDSKKWVEILYSSYKAYGNNWKDVFESLANEYEAWSKKYNNYDSTVVEKLFMMKCNKENAISFAEDYIYPFWYRYWRTSSISKTLESINRHYDKLKSTNVRKEGFKDSIVTINFAINAAHQTGKMKDHIAFFTDVTIEDLDKLSNIDMHQIKLWNKDLIQSGITPLQERQYLTRYKRRFK
jgi:hypothetical protein